ncbi:CLUMA_CG007058, isoform A [Clunio marinus]|uniref:CLUMA_CG007058, isoform A n=1 Tax=Clunio marinus TaxID=568069 RepID=A0A1J1HZS4_9DIPT|nr:CLUMA_CG007058, isoform A [Clunio marinus]
MMKMSDVSFNFPQTISNKLPTLTPKASLRNSDNTFDSNLDIIKFNENFTMLLLTILSDADDDDGDDVETS